MSEMKVNNIQVPQFNCLNPKCGLKWIPRPEEPDDVINSDKREPYMTVYTGTITLPKQCTGCKSTKWNDKDHVWQK